MTLNLLPGLTLVMPNGVHLCDLREVTHLTVLKSPEDAAVWLWRHSSGVMCLGPAPPTDLVTACLRGTMRQVR